MEQSKVEINVNDAHMINRKIDDKVDAPDADQLAKTKALLIRHATTQFNIEFQKTILAHGEVSEEYKQLKINKSLIDPPLNELGRTQAINGQEHINKINFKYVFVSPMMRTCETAMILFQNHPNKDKIKFIVLPNAKEGMHLCNDLIGPLDKIKAIYANPEKCHGLNFDFSRCYNFGNEAIWQTNIVADFKEQKYGLKCIKDDAENIDQANEQFLQHVYDEFPLRLEHFAQLYQRAQIVRNFMNYYTAHVDPLQGDEKCGLVSHSSFLQALSAGGQEADGQLKDYTNFKNCQIWPWSNFEQPLDPNHPF